jgi:hypothetical protein
MEKLQRGHNLCRIELCPLNIEPAAKRNFFDKLTTKTEIRLNMFLFVVLSSAIKYGLEKNNIKQKRDILRIFHNNETLLAW